MKIFKVKIDNNPGAWKSGEDPSVLVIANTEQEAIEKVKNGWGGQWDYKCHSITFSKNIKNDFAYVRPNSQLSATEIIFEGYEIINVRKAKLKKLNEL